MKPQKVLLVLLDGLRLDTLQVHPIFNRIAKEGTFFDNLITYAPYTTASMHAILSGIYGSRNGVNSYYTASNFNKDDCLTLQGYFAREGFSTALDKFKNTVPFYGFKYVSDYDEFDQRNRSDLFKRHKNFLDTYIVKKRKALLLLHNLKSHTELVDKFRHTYNGPNEALYYEDIERNRRDYEGYVREMGEYLEKILEYLQKIKFFNEGLLVVFSDHGTSLGELPGERMYGTYLNDYTIKSFACFIGERFVEKGKVNSNLFRTVDIMPTILDIFGIHIKKDYLELDGLSIFNSMNSSPRYAFVETAPLAGPNPSPYVPNYHGIISDKYKLLYHSERDEIEFFIHNNDTWETAGTDNEEYETHLSELCKISPIVNRINLNKDTSFDYCCCDPG